MKFTQSGRLFASLLVMIVARPAVADESRLSLQQAVELGLQQNPALAAVGANATAAGYEVPQAGALADPHLSIGLANLPANSFSLNQDPMTQLQIGLNQALPFPGKRGLMEKAARQRAEAATQGSDETRLQLVKQIKQTWWQLFYFDQALKTLEQNRDLYGQVVQSAETLYSVGRGQQQEVLLAQLEIARLDDEALQLTQQRREAQIQLNRLLDRSPATPIVLAATPPTNLPAVPPARPLQEQALARRPELHARQAQVVAAQARRELSRKEQYPDFALATGYGIRSGRDNLVSIQLSMNLPLYAGRKQSRAEDQRQAELIAMREQLREARQRIAAEVALALVRYQRARDQVTLFNGSILPQAQQTVASLLAGYQVNKVAFADLVRGQTTLHNYQTQYWRAYSAAHQALAELDAAVGKENLDE